MSTLPKGWAHVTLNDVAMWASGGTPSRANKEYYTGSIPWIKTGELGSRIIYSAEEYISDAAISESSAKVFPKGSVGIAMYGATIGKTSIFGIDVATNQACAVGIPDAVSSDFLYYFLISQEKRFIDAGKGGAQPNISQGIVKSWPIWLPPFAEQARIVEKLEELLTLLDAGVGELKTAQKKLAQYRQSLLKAAVEGALTTEWRESNPPAESGAQLLERILLERRARWEAKQLAKFAEQGKKPPKDWQKNYPEPVQPDTTDLPLLPEGWVWASVEQIASDEQYSLAIGPFGSNLKVPDYRDSGVPLIFVRNIRSGNYGGVYTKFVSQVKAKELGAHSVVAGDVLVTKMGEPPGDADVYPEPQPLAIITADCIKIRCCSEIISPFFLKIAINSNIGKRQIEPMTQGVAQKKVSLGRFSKLAVPVPPTDEQSLIVRMVGEAENDAIAQLAAIDISLKQCSAQRQNILRAAFSGQLVPQNPNDEPTSVLLERIRAQRAEQTPVKNPRGRRVKGAI